MVFAENTAPMETPVISFATGGVPEAVLHGETGIPGPRSRLANFHWHVSLLLLKHAIFAGNLKSPGVNES